MSKVLVTGGAGFIGSHLVDKLITKNEIVVFDNLSSGSLRNLEHLKNNKNFSFIKSNLLNPKNIESALDGVSKVYHIAANPDVRLGETNTKAHFEQNIVASYNLLEAMRKKDVEKIIFTSSSTVYGDAKIIPTPEDYPTIPISIYGASKLAVEGMISSYCHTFGMQAVIFRFANVIGSRSEHGVIVDFIKKLKNNPNKLEILGDGNQTKSYIYIKDCIEGMLFGEENTRNKFEIFNLGSEDKITVKEIANLVVSNLGLKNVKYEFTGGYEGRGWKGDVKLMQLSIDKIKKLGWKPKYSSKEAIIKTINDLKYLF
ncbi:MAG: NAD-dependent epimerase/dehydratase family protein [Candidatus Aenigmatarchaeota archaeon]